MFSSLGTKIALKKVGLPSNTFDFFEESSQPRREPNKLRKKPPANYADGTADDNADESWGSWMSIPLTVQPWLSPPPPPVTVKNVPNVGSLAPMDRDGKLKLGGGRRTLVVFLRCVGCAFAQKTFLNLRTIANRTAGSIRCIAVSHSSPQATKKWVDLLGGAWTVEVVIDEDRAIYAAWGLGLGSVWSIFHPTAQLQGWKEKGWLGNQVADSIQKSNSSTAPTNPNADEADDATTMGNKWQEAGAFAVDGKGTVIWGGKALRSDDVMNLDEGAQLLEL